MLLIKIEKFRERYFTEDSMPAMSTLRRWIDDDELPGGKRYGSLYYVDLHEWEAQDDELVARVMSA